MDWNRLPPFPPIFFAINVLLDTLVRAVPNSGGNIATRVKIKRLPLPSLHGYPSPSASFLLDALSMNGWCIHQARRFCSKLTYNVVYYLASLPLQHPLLNHRACLDRDYCVASKSPSYHDTYTCLHTTNSCECEIVSSPEEDMEQVKAVIKEGGIPIISFSRGPSGLLILKAVPYRSEMRYTAISHIWSDGLGNPHENALPRCQLEKLVERVIEAETTTRWMVVVESISRDSLMKNQRKNISIKIEQAADLKRIERINEKKKRRRSFSALGKNQTVNIWMDTLRIPIGNEELKRKAIGRMTPTYTKASRVLVLDSGLSFISDTVSFWSVRETVAHLLLSNWNSRTWTLQEGAPAREIAYPLFYDAVNHRRDRGVIRDYYRSSIWNDIYAAHDLPAVGQWHRPFSFRDRLSSRDTLVLRRVQFLGVWNAFVGRNTTMEEDMHSIFANLLDFNADEIMSLDKRFRMKSILCAQYELPMDLLYLPDEMNASTDPLDRWLPGFPKRQAISDGCLWMRVTPEGLVIRADDSARRTIVVSHEIQTARQQKYLLHIDGYGKVAVSIQHASHIPYVQYSHTTTILHLSSQLDNDSPSLLKGPSMAASLAVKRHTGEIFEVLYDDIVNLQLWEETNQISNFKDCPCFEGRVLDIGHSILVDIGTSQAYKPRLRRKPNTLTPYAKGRIRPWLGVLGLSFLFIGIFLSTIIWIDARLNDDDDSHRTDQHSSMITKAILGINAGVSYCITLVCLLASRSAVKVVEKAWLVSFDESEWEKCKNSEEPAVRKRRRWWFGCRRNNRGSTRENND